MSYLVVCVVDDPEKCVDLLPAWDRAGAPGATILESIGMQRVQARGARDDLPLMPTISDLFRKMEIRHRTVFSVVDDPAVIDRIVEVSEEILGPFEEEHTGFLFTVEVDRVFGMWRK